VISDVFLGGKIVFYHACWLRIAKVTSLLKTLIHILLSVLPPTGKSADKPMHGA
jgi:hypothetical protein